MNDLSKWRMKAETRTRTSRGLWMQLIIYITLLIMVIVCWSAFGSGAASCFSVLTDPQPTKVQDIYDSSTRIKKYKIDH